MPLARQHEPASASIFRVGSKQKIFLPLSFCHNFFCKGYCCRTNGISSLTFTCCDLRVMSPE